MFGIENNTGLALACVNIVDDTIAAKLDGVKSDEASASTTDTSEKVQDLGVKLAAGTIDFMQNPEEAEGLFQKVLTQMPGQNIKSLQYLNAELVKGGETASRAAGVVGYTAGKIVGLILGRIIGVIAGQKAGRIIEEAVALVTGAAARGAVLLAAQVGRLALLAGAAAIAVIGGVSFAGLMATLGTIALATSPFWIAAAIVHQNSKKQMAQFIKANKASKPEATESVVAKSVSFRKDPQSRFAYNLFNGGSVEVGEPKAAAPVVAEPAPEPVVAEPAPEPVVVKLAPKPVADKSSTFGSRLAAGLEDMGWI